MMSNDDLFIEKQYLGRDYPRISVRLSMVIFCFMIYFIGENRERSNELFLVVGVGILIISLLMMFLLHYRISVKPEKIILEGLWTSRKVEIDLSQIVKVERKTYSHYLINNPVYNLHQKGKVRFYTGGKDALFLTDKSGLEYVIGTQQPAELEQAVRKAMQT